MEEIFCQETKCWFKEVIDIQKFVEVRKRIERFDKCALTNEPLDLKNGFFMLFSNFELFPNCFVNKIPTLEIGWEKTIEQVTSSWKEAQKFQHWFD